MKIATSMLIAVSFTACVLAGEDDEDLELGSSELAASVKGSPTYTYGTRTGSSGLACDRTSTGQVCTMPNNLTFKVCLRAGTFSDPDVTTADQARATLDASVKFDLARVTSDTCNGARIAIESGVCSGSNQSNSIEHFACITQYTLGESLTESLPGSYQTHAVCKLRVDMSKIALRAANQTERQQLLTHATTNGLLRCLGVGSRSDLGTQAFHSNRSVSPIGNRSVLTSGESCRVASYSPTLPAGQFVVTTSVCSSD